MDANRLFLTRRPAHWRAKAARRIALAGAAIGSALLLSGCDVDRVSALEERLNAVEAKADAADKRSKAAEALAVSQGQTVSQPDPVPQSDINPEGDDPEPAIDDGGDVPPPPPMADNGKS